MAQKSRRVVREKKVAYQARSDQRSDPKPKSKLARNLAKLTPLEGHASAWPNSERTRRSSSLRDPNGALYAYDTQKAMEFAD